jgi:polyferredoxin
MFHVKAWTHVSGTYMPVMIEFWLIPVFAVLLSLREKMYFCRKICPLGALVRFFASFNPFFKPTLKSGKHVVKESSKTGEGHGKVSCSECVQMDQKVCEEVCPQGIGPIEAKGSAKCTKCFECYVGCEKGIVGIKRFGTPDAVLKIKRFLGKLKRRKKKQNS